MRAEDLRDADFDRRYELRGELGRGGMGTVVDALDRRLGRSIALKVASPEKESTTDSERRRLARFMEEMESRAFALFFRFLLSSRRNSLGVSSRRPSRAIC